MTAHTPTPLPSLAASALASGVLTTLVPPSRIPVSVRRSIHAASALAGVGAALVLARRGGASEEKDPKDPLPLPVQVGLAGALGSFMALASAGGMALDSAAENALARRGVQHPRLWMGVAVAGLTAGMSWAETRMESAQ